MAKSFIDVVQDSRRTRLGIPVKTKKNPSLKPIHRPWNRLSALNFTGGWFRLIVAYESFIIRSPGTHPHSRSHVRLNRPAAPAGEGKSSLPSTAWRTRPPGTHNRGCKPRCDFYCPSPFFFLYAHGAFSSLLLV